MNKLTGLFILAFLWTVGSGQTSKIMLSQQEALEIAAKNNPALKSSKERINAAKGRFWSGVSPSAPSISVSYEYVPVGASLKHFGERTFEIAQEIEFPTNIFLKGTALSKEIEAAEQEYLIVSNAVTAQVRIAYYTVLARQKLVKLAAENESLAQDFANKSEIRFNVGEATNLERLTARVQLTEAQNNLEIARNTLKTALSELVFALGYGKEFDATELILTDTLKYEPCKLPFEDLQTKAQQSNPQLRAQRLQVNVASTTRSLAWSGILPNFRLSYFRQEQNGKSDYYGALFGVSAPLWFLFDQRGKIQEASASLSGAKFELQTLINSIAAETKNDYLNHKNEERQLMLYQSDLLPQAEEIYRTASASYMAGEISYIEFLQAKQTLIGARVNYTNALLNYHLALVELERIVGARLE